MSMVDHPNTEIVARSKNPSAALAAQLNVDTGQLVATLRQTVIPGNATDAECYAFCLIAATYGLNPIMKEIHAFPKKGGGIQTVVGIDGWIKVVNRQPLYDGMEFEEEVAAGKPVKTTCLIHVKGRSHPVKITEWFDECKRGSEPWNLMPKRMLRHKALIQCARVAFGISGLYDEDEGRDIAEGRTTVVNDASSAATKLNEKLKTGKVAESVVDASFVVNEVAPMAVKAMQSHPDEYQDGNGEESRPEAPQQPPAVPTAAIVPKDVPPPNTAEATPENWQPFATACVNMAVKLGCTRTNANAGISHFLLSKDMVGKGPQTTTAQRDELVELIGAGAGKFARAEKAE